MRGTAYLLFASGAVALAIASMIPASGQADKSSAPVDLTQMPPGYRDWRMISLAHEEGSLHSFAAVLGNDTAIKAYRDGTLPFPDGTIIAALHYSHSPSEENNKVFGQAQSFTPGAPTNIQFMIYRTRKNMRRPAAGGMDTSAPMANQAAKPYSVHALRATPRHLAIPSLRGMLHSTDWHGQRRRF